MTPAEKSENVTKREITKGGQFSSDTLFSMPLSDSKSSTRPFLWKLPASGDWTHYIKYSILAGGFFLICYYGSWWIAQQHQYRIVIPQHGGQLLPFQPGWVIVYISINLAHTLAPFAVASREECTAWALSLCNCVAMASVIFICFPTDQPSVEHLKDLSGSWMELYWSNSIITTSSNAFPSLHVGSMLCTVWYSTQKKPRWFKVVMYAWFFLVVYSTFALREHYIVDAIGGAVIAAVAIRRSQKGLMLSKTKHLGQIDRIQLNG